MPYAAFGIAVRDRTQFRKQAAHRLRRAIQPHFRRIFQHEEPDGDSLFRKSVYFGIRSDVHQWPAPWLAPLLKAESSRLGAREKVVVITGGSRGLGLAMAEEFGRRGARLVLAARDEERNGA